IVLLVLGTLMALTRAAKEEEGAGVVEPGPASLRTKRETKAIVTPQVKKLLKIKKKYEDGAYSDRGGFSSGGGGVYNGREYEGYRGGNGRGNLFAVVLSSSSSSSSSGGSGSGFGIFSLG
ncbi:unnamed protein product, partial [Darwinula stevensoni]